MSLWTSLEPASATVDPGGSTRVRLRLRNTGDVVDEYRFEPVGTVAPWTTVEPSTLRLYPGTTGTVELTFAPPRTPDAAAGPHPYGVRITPTEHPEATTVPEGNLTITPFTEVRADLVPPIVRGRLRGRPRLAVDNLGNTKLTASVSGSDNGDQLSYEIHPSNVQIEPGRAVFVAATLKPRNIIWFGAAEQRPYTLSLHRSGTDPLPVEGTYDQRGFLPRWLATALGLAVTLAIVFVMLWIAYKPAVKSKTTEQVAEAGNTLAPSPDASPKPPEPAPSKADPTPTEQQEEPGDGGDGGGGGGDDKTKKPPPKVTAATAVRRLAQEDPSGRHICYRAFVGGEGWQEPVCDGAVAGMVGRKLPIKAMNFAVSGVGGSAASAFVNDPESDKGKFQEWTAVIADRKDNYIGKSKDDAPNLSGFGINVGDGQICQSSHVRGRSWGDRCGGSRSHPDRNNRLVFAGTLDNGAWLEAVKLTVKK
ncbi:hydrolase [Streptomyces sp. NPDC047315]|uniref:hydrolase n=1 Tax=Streptomyces sp. NPDC047315 TaxID=3155142 RepID=UPI0034044796